MSKHTPGPWNLCDPMNPDRAFGIEAHDDAEGPDGDATQCVAEVCVGDTAESDARLIAAAPDLLGALKHALEDGDDWRGLAESAIRKAEGGEA